MIENIVDRRENKFKAVDLIAVIEPCAADNFEDVDTIYEWTDDITTDYAERVKDTIKEALNWGNSFKFPVTLFIYDFEERVGHETQEARYALGALVEPELDPVQELPKEILENYETTSMQENVDTYSDELTQGLNILYRNHKMPEDYLYFIVIKADIQSEELISRLNGLHGMVVFLYKIKRETLITAHMIIEQILSPSSAMNPLLAVSKKQLEYIRMVAGDLAIELIVRMRRDFLETAALTFEASREFARISKSTLQQLSSILNELNEFEVPGSSRTSEAILSIKNTFAKRTNRQQSRDLLNRRRDFFRSQMKVTYQIDLKDGSPVDYEVIALDGENELPAG
jgi:hypothetical protein